MANSGLTQMGVNSLFLQKIMIFRVNTLFLVDKRWTGRYMEI